MRNVTTSSTRSPSAPMAAGSRQDSIAGEFDCGSNALRSPMCPTAASVVSPTLAIKTLGGNKKRDGENQSVPPETFSSASPTSDF